jgi:hypothetical protein
MVASGLVALISFYSYSVYPILPQGFGGGKPARVVLWFGNDDFPPDLKQRMPRAVFASDEKVTRGENLYLLYESSEAFILADSDHPPAAGLSIARDKVKAISW